MNAPFTLSTQYSAPTQASRVCVRSLLMTGPDVCDFQPWGSETHGDAKTSAIHQVPLLVLTCAQRHTFKHMQIHTRTHTHTHTFISYNNLWCLILLCAFCSFLHPVSLSLSSFPSCLWCLWRCKTNSIKLDFTQLLLSPCYSFTVCWVFILQLQSAPRVSSHRAKQNKNPETRLGSLTA